MEQLKVSIGADTKELKKGLTDAEKAINNFSNKSKQIESQLKSNAVASSKLGAEISKLKSDFNSGAISSSEYGRGMLKLVASEKQLSNETKTLRSDLSKLNASTRDLGSKGMGTLQKGTVSGNSAMTAFSRTIQDAPFGFMGISNNITNLTEQFGYLKNKTGSAGGALKAMLADMKGFGGITLLISLATSAMLMYQQSQQGVKKSTNELVEAQKDLVGGAMQEISSIQSLLSIAKNENESKRKRQLALMKLQELYPKYLNNVTLEKINTLETADAVRLLTKELIQQAKIKGLQSRLSEVHAKRYEVENKKAAEQVSTLKTLWIGVKNLGDITKSSMEAGSVAIANQKDEISKLDKEIAVLNGTIQGLLSNDINFDKIFGGTTKDVATKLETETFIPIIDKTNLFGENLNAAIENTNLQLEGRGYDWAAAYKANKLIEEQNKVEANLLAFSERARGILEMGRMQMLTGFGDAIGTALSNGGNVLEAAGMSLLSSLGSIMVEYGQLILAFGLASEALKVAMENPFGGGIAAVVAGIALIAIGSAIKGFASSTSKGGSSSGTSTSSSGGGSAYSTGSGYSAPTTSRSSSSGGGFGGGTVVFEIAGQKLVGVLSNTLQRNKNLGGTLSITT